MSEELKLEKVITECDEEKEVEKMEDKERDRLNEGLRATIIIRGYKKLYGLPPKWASYPIIGYIWIIFKGKKYYNKLRAYEKGWADCEIFIKKVYSNRKEVD